MMQFPAKERYQVNNHRELELALWPGVKMCCEPRVEHLSGFLHLGDIKIRRVYLENLQLKVMASFNTFKETVDI